MKVANFLIVLVFACSCKPEPTSSIPEAGAVAENYILLPSASVSFNNDVVFLNGKKYAGFLYRLNLNGKDTLSKEGYVQGLLSGISRKWYSNKQLMEERQYAVGKKNGKQTAWWENGNKKFEFVAKDDAYEGELKEWTMDGKLIHLAHFVNGQEEGVQKLWYDNGKIRANYVIFKGKRYGLLGTKNCRNVLDSIFVVK